MKLVKPEVYKISGVVLDYSMIDAYLESIGVEDWDSYHHGLNISWNAVEPASEELLIEIMGRLCYKSWEPGLNPNVTRIRSDSKEYIQNMLKQGHGSVFEHVQLSFMFSNVSRIFTHELVSHRVGTAISQESMRYVRLVDIPIWIPPSLNNEELNDDIAEVLHHMEYLQAKWVEVFELDTSKSFEHKKRITSALRRFFSPTGVATQIGWSCNVRELRHIIQLRTVESAEEEIRYVFDEVAKIVVKEHPILFGDLIRNEKGEWNV
jgi:thymidylate synthase (FAD)